MPDKIRNVFISHVFEDDDGLGKLAALTSSKGFTVRDSSIDSDNRNKATNDAYIKSEILAPRINWASVLVVLITPATRQSEYVNWEIECAQKLGKRIVGVWGHGASGADVPDALDQFADAVVGWNADRIIGAIEGTINNWSSPDGTMRPARPIKRVTCA